MTLRPGSKIRYLLTGSAVEGMGDVEKILQVLIRKDEQAQRNIGERRRPTVRPPPLRDRDR